MTKPNPPKEIVPILGEKEQRIRTHLIEFVHNLKYRIKPYVFYQDLSNECHLDLNMNNPDHRRDLGTYLDKVSLYEIRYGRPVLSSLVLATDYEFGEGFYTLCAQEFPELGNRTKQKGDRIDIQMTNECIDFWKDETNYNSSKHYPEDEAYILRSTLIAAAASRKTLYYGDLVAKKDPYHMGLLIGKLNKLSEIENNAGRPLLSAIVINKKTKLPGVGFWELCDILNIKDKSWENIKNKCFDYWETHEK